MTSGHCQRVLYIVPGNRAVRKVSSYSFKPQQQGLSHARECMAWLKGDPTDGEIIVTGETDISSLENERIRALLLHQRRNVRGEGNITKCDQSIAKVLWLNDPAS